MNSKKEEKKSVYAILLIGMSMIVLGLTIGQNLKPMLYIFIPSGLFFLILAFILVKKNKYID